MTFDEYLAEEAVATKRQNMIHFQAMKPLEFVEFARQIKNEFRGKLHNIATAMKVDGLAGRFGKTDSGAVFFEGARTGPIFVGGAFSDYAKKKGSDQIVIDRAVHYDDLWEIITKSPQMKVVPNGAKIICEIFYNPMATEDDDGITFVSVKYDKSKLGSLMTIVPFAVTLSASGEKHPDQEKILKALFATSDSKIKVVDAKLKMGTIDFGGMIDPITALSDDMLAAVKSLKHADKPTKASTIAIIQAVKDQMAAYILDHPAIVDKFKLGPEIEGIVLSINNKDYKITTQKFKDSKAK